MSATRAHDDAAAELRAIVAEHGDDDIVTWLDGHLAKIGPTWTTRQRLAHVWHGAVGAQARAPERHRKLYGRIRALRARITPRLDAALDGAEDALADLAVDLDAKATLFSDAVDVATALLFVASVDRALFVSRARAGLWLAQLGAALGPGSERQRAYAQATSVHAEDVTAATARTWAQAWAMYGDAQAAAS